MQVAFHGQAEAFRHSFSRRAAAMASNPIPTSELQIYTETTPNEIIFRCVGRITSATTSLLKSEVRQAISEKKTVVLDLSQVGHMDSSGLGVLVSLWASAKREGSELKLGSLGQRVKELLRLTGLEKVLATSRFPDTPSF
jgi:anti-anti-sigma factor